MGNVRGTDEVFERREASVPDLSDEEIFPGEIKVKVLLEADQKWRLVEEFGPSSFTQDNDDRLLFITGYSDIENLVTWIMASEDKAELLEPVGTRKKIVGMVQKMTKICKEGAML